MLQASLTLGALGLRQGCSHAVPERLLCNAPDASLHVCCDLVGAHGRIGLVPLLYEQCSVLQQCQSRALRWLMVANNTPRQLI